MNDFTVFYWLRVEEVLTEKGIHVMDDVMFNCVDVCVGVCVSGCVWITKLIFTVISVDVKVIKSACRS